MQRIHLLWCPASWLSQPHPLQPCGPTRIRQLPPVHIPVVGDVLQAEPVGTEGVFIALGRVRTRPVEIILGEGIEKCHRRLTHFAAFGKDLVERRVLAHASRRVGSVEEILLLR